METIASYGSTTMPSSPGITPQRSLKMKRSLSRLFSGSSRKSSRSRPPSPTADSPDTPPTPQVPADLWPPTPTSSTSPKPPHTQIPKIPQQCWGASIHTQDLTAESAATETKVSGRRRRKTEVTIASSTSDQISRTISDDASGIAKSERSSITRMPTNRKERSLTGLRMPSAFNSVPRGRGASVRLPHNKSTPNLALPSRPSTAGGNSQSKTLTGKRRPSEAPHGHDGAEGSAPAVEDFSTDPPQRPWHAMYNQDEVRSSFRSALTTGSSHVGTSSTERNSVATKGTSITSSAIDPHSRPTSKAGGMTVDDAIEMYVAGFADETDNNLDESRDPSLSSDGDRRRSIRIAEAISDNMGSEPSSQRLPLSRQSTSSNGIATGQALRREAQSPPPIMPSTTTRDQYGFLKASHHITVSQYDLWNSEYLPSQERRTRKWQSYMRDCNLPTYQPRAFPPRSPKTQRFILKGLPPAWRGAAWFYYAGGEIYLSSHPHLYSNLLTTSELSLSDNDKEAIERDLHRTFPDNIHFKTSPHTSLGSSDPEVPLLSSLRCVLRAFAAHNSKVGYCQSLNFLAGLLLLFLPEEKAFIMLHIITTTILPGTHDVSLEGANIDLWVLMVALKSTQPAIWSKVGSSGPGEDALNMPSTKLPPISLCTTSWFMSLFIGTLPVESVLRVWDVLFYDGARTLFRVALAIFKLGEKRIAELKDDMELFQVVQGLPRGMLDATSLMQMVSRKGGVGGEWVEERRRERRRWYANERARVAKEVLGVVEDTGKDGVAEREAENMAPRGIRRRNSLWIRKRSVAIR